jgi:hypothetical protein
MKIQSIWIQRRSRTPEKVTQPINSTRSNIHTQEQTFKMMGLLQNETAPWSFSILLFYFVVNLIYDNRVRFSTALIYTLNK